MWVRISQDFPTYLSVQPDALSSVFHGRTHFCSAPCAILSRGCTILIKILKTPKSWCKEIYLASLNPAFLKFMSPWRLLKYDTHQDPAELVIWNILGACLYNANILKCTESQTPGKWNHLEVIKAFVEKHNILMLRAWKKEIIQTGNHASHHLGIVAFRKN